MAIDPAIRGAGTAASDGVSFGRAAHVGLFVLTFINLFNYLDRYVLSALVESLERMRATAVAASIFAIHLLGDVPSPPVIGALSDATSLATAVLVVPAVFLVAGLVWTAGAPLGDRRGWAS